MVNQNAVSSGKWKRGDKISVLRHTDAALKKFFFICFFSRKRNDSRVFHSRNRKGISLYAADLIISFGKMDIQIFKGLILRKHISKMCVSVRIRSGRAGKSVADSVNGNINILFTVIFHLKGKQKDLVVRRTGSL